MRLYKNMYSAGNRSDLFGLYEGQMRSVNCESGGRSADEKIVHNGGWYNRRGEKLGWGDISLEDMARIRDNLLPREAFFVLGERDSFWEFVTASGPIGELCVVDEIVYEPGLQYVLQKCRWVIVPGAIYEVRDDDGKGEVSVEGVTYRVTTREEISEILMPLS